MVFVASRIFKISSVLIKLYNRMIDIFEFFGLATVQ